MNTLQIQNITLDELSTLIANTVESKIQSLIPEPQPEVEYLTRQETAKKLGISLVTLNRWTKDGIIKAHRINTRIRYKSDEVDMALNEVESLKYKRRG